MIVNWTEQRMKVIPLVATKDIPPSLFQGKDQVILYPGYNEIPDNIFEAIRPHIQSDIDLKRIKLAEQKKEDKVSGKVVAKPIPVKAVPMDKLRDMLAKTVNLDSLREWLAKETRPEARLVIQTRIEFLEKELSLTGADAPKKEGEGDPLDSDSDDSDEE